MTERYAVSHTAVVQMAHEGASDRAAKGILACAWVSML